MTSTSTSPSLFPSSLSTDNIADRHKDKVNHNDEDKDVIDATSSILPIIAATSPPTTSTTTTTTASPTSPTTAPSSALPSLPTFLLNDVKDIRLALNSVKIQRTFLRPKNFPPQIPTFLNISYEQVDFLLTSFKKFSFKLYLKMMDYFLSVFI